MPNKFPSFPIDKDLGDADKALIFKEEFRPREFLYNKSEYGADYRTSVFISADSFGVVNLELYEVPKGKKFYITSVCLSGYNGSIVGNALLALRRGVGTGNDLFAIQLSRADRDATDYVIFPHDTQSIAYVMPLRITEGEKLFLRIDNGDAKAKICVQGYEE